MTHIRIASGVFAIMLCANMAWADDANRPTLLPASNTQTLVRDLPSKGIVSISGTVEKVDSSQKFTLRDSSGVISVSMPAKQSLVLKDGEGVSVIGTVNNGFLGLTAKTIDATDVQVHKDLGTAVSDAITQTTGISLDQAKTEQINTLPKQGMVKLSGTVQHVQDAKNFTLKDATGTIHVNVQSNENVVLVKNAEVTVIGYVHDGILGKNIRATHVMVTASTSPQAGIAGNTLRIAQ